jgi:group I intron endonuclease
MNNKNDFQLLLISIFFSALFFVGIKYNFSLYIFIITIISLFLWLGGEKEFIPFLFLAPIFTIVLLLSFLFEKKNTNNFTKQSLNTIQTIPNIENKQTLKIKKKYEIISLNVPDIWKQYFGVVGIYKITNLKNGKLYIGESINIEKRWENHFFDLVKKQHHNFRLQQDFNIYGINNFKPELLFKIPYTTYEDTKKRLIKHEQEQIEKELSLGKTLYNYDNSCLLNNEREFIDTVYQEKNISLLDNHLEPSGQFNFEHQNKQYNDKKQIFYDCWHNVYSNWNYIKEDVRNGEAINILYFRYTSELEREYLSVNDFGNICFQIHQHFKNIRIRLSPISAFLNFTLWFLIIFIIICGILSLLF